MKILRAEKPMYIMEGAKLVPPFELFKVEFGSARYYYRAMTMHKVKWYMSATTFCSQVMPRNPFLEKWKIETDGHEEVAEIAAHYGTIMHAQNTNYLIDKKWDPAALMPFIDRYVEQEGIIIDEKTKRSWARAATSDIISWAQFCEDYSVEPIAIEYPGASDSLGLAGRMDLVARITPIFKSGQKKGEPKGDPFIALIDMKSGRKGFYDAHIVQMHVYRDIWNETFPNFKIERVFNWAPNDWRKVPTYKFTEQTGKVSRHLMEAYYTIAKELNLAAPSGATKKVLEPLEFGQPIDGKYERKEIIQSVEEAIRDNFTSHGRRRKAIAKRLEQSEGTAKGDEARTGKADANIPASGGRTTASKVSRHDSSGVAGGEQGKAKNVSRQAAD